jgi:hypothetical protein
MVSLQLESENVELKEAESGVLGTGMEESLERRWSKVQSFL